MRFWTTSTIAVILTLSLVIVQPLLLNLPIQLIRT